MPGSAAACLGLSCFGYDTTRWISRDPFGENGGINLYGYVGNNSISNVDPMGLFWSELADESNPFNLHGSYAQTALSIGDAIRGLYEGITGNGWSDFINAGNGQNGNPQGLFEQTKCNKYADYTAKAFFGISALSISGAAYMLGGEALASRGMFSLSSHVSEQVSAGGGRYWSETMARNLFNNGTRALNTGGRNGLVDTLTTITYRQPGGGEIIRNWITNTITHYLPY